MREPNKKSVREQIQALQLPPVVLRIFDGEAVHPALSYRASSPYMSFASGCGVAPDFLPFWECDDTISGYSRAAQEFQEISVEEPDVHRFSGGTFRELFLQLIFSLWEDEHSAESLFEIAVLFGMPPLDDLLQTLVGEPEDPEEQALVRAVAVRQYLAM